MKKKHSLNAIIAGLIPSLTQNLSTAAQAARDGAKTLLEPGAGLINKSDRAISKNPQAFGFAFEHLQALGFNINAALQGSEARAYQIPADGTTQYSPDIYVEKIGEVIAQIQAKAGSSEYVRKQASSDRYSGKILTNSENSGLDNTTIVIDVDGIHSFPIPLNVTQWVAKNPYLAANFIQTSATVGEIGSAGAVSATIQATIEVVLQSIVILGAYCRGEQEIAQKELDRILGIAIKGLQNGFIRGAAIKVIQKLMKGNAFAALGFTLSAEVIPVLIQVIMGEMSYDRAIAQVGPRAFTSGVITTLVLLFPPIGTALLSTSILQAIWVEISPEWKQAVNNGIHKGIAASQAHLKQNPWDLLGSSSASATASAAEMQAMQDELDRLLE
ncbi:hypothetical protein [Lusitaniella coriacea]|uniref:hypothetical protein n=1 Tax=Lusitaniella coriacea TaxID=1983105 RepID=UPI003CF9972C